MKLFLHIEKGPGLYCGATIVRRITTMTRGGPERYDDKSHYCQTCLSEWKRDGSPKYVTDESGGYYKR